MESGGTEEVESRLLLRIICTGRRLITTVDGKFGLRHAKAREGDLVCVLLGADVPYILRSSNHESGSTIFHSEPCRFSFVCNWRKHLRCCLPALHLLIGQAYVDGSMFYDGDVAADIESGVIELEQFGLE